MRCSRLCTLNVVLRPFCIQVCFWLPRVRDVNNEGIMLATLPSLSGRTGAVWRRRRLNAAENGRRGTGDVLKTGGATAWRADGGITRQAGWRWRRTDSAGPGRVCWTGRCLLAVLHRRDAGERPGSYGSGRAVLLSRLRQTRYKRVFSISPNHSDERRAGGHI